MFGIVMAGAVYCPLNPEYPAERLQGIMKICGAAAVLTSPGLRSLVTSNISSGGVETKASPRGSLTGGAPQVIVMGDDIKIACTSPSSLVPGMDSPKSSAAGVADLMMPFGEINVSKNAYVITTSGSTGWSLSPLRFSLHASNYWTILLIVAAQ
jgi:acyl-CoA synthetase (AMP-forming)/AMP-acid ligase II